MRRKSRVLPVVVVVVVGALTLGTALTQGQEELREFTDVKGRKLNAEFLGLQDQGASVSLRLSTGKIVVVGLERLSADDQNYIKSHPLGKLKPVALPARPLHPVKEWNEKVKGEITYFIDAEGRPGIRRTLTSIQGNGFADCLGEYAIVTGPQLGVIDTNGSSVFGVSSVGPDGVEPGGTDVPIFIARTGEGERATYSYLNKTGKPFIRRNFAGARPFNSERAWVNLEPADLPKQKVENGIWTLIDYKGALLHAFENLEVQDFSEGRAGVATDVKSRNWSIIDTDAKVIAEGPFTKVWPFIDGAAVVDGRLMDREGKWILGEDAEWFIENRHALSENDAIVARRKKREQDKSRYSILQRSSGEFLADIPDNLYVEDGFFNGLAMVRDIKTGKCGYLNRLGNLVIEIKFERAERFRNAFAKVSIKTVHDLGVINLAGDVIWQPERMPEIEPPKPEPANPAPDAPPEN